MSVEQVQAIILGSAEYAQRAGGSDTAFLQAVYHDILGRPLDSASAASWSTALTQLDHAGVAALILASPEAEQDRIQAAYQRYLHRPADPPGLASWLLQLQHGLSDQSLTANILGATEFFSRM